MLVRCPRCETGFNLPVEKIPDKGAKLKCSACTHKFRVRLDDDGKPEIFYKKKSQDDFNNRTMIGAPISEGAVDEEDGGSTQFGAPAKSKSARADYDPFPLANQKTRAVDDADEADDADGADEAEEDEETGEEHNERTQFGRPPTAVGQDPLDEEDVDLFDSPFDDDGNRTELGPAARSSAAESQSSPPPVPADDERGKTQALGSKSLDLFDGEELDDEPVEPLDEGSDPFDSAFEEPVSDDVGLLMPSTPTSEDVPLEPTTLSDGSHPSDPNVDIGMSEDAFLSGQQSSEFGRAEDLVDPEFGSDVPGFDPSGGVVDREKRPKPSRSGKTRKGPEDASEEPKLELADVGNAAAQKKKTVAKRPRPTPRPEPATQQKPQQKQRKKQPTRKLPTDYAPHRVGDPSTARRVFDAITIGLVVCVAFVVFVAARTGWVVDFTRFGHMLEVAFAGEEFQPRQEWARVVEVTPPEPPPEEPLRLEDVRAREVLVGDSPIFVVSGRIKNYSLEAFEKVKVHAEIVDSSDETVADKTVMAGQTLDREKLTAAKKVEDVPGLLDKSIPDVGKEGSVPFTVVFTDLPTEKLESGELDYRVSLAE